MVPVNPPEADNQNPLVLQAKEDLAGRLGIAISEIDCCHLKKSSGLIPA